MVSVSLFKIPSYFACCTDVTKLADASTVQRGFFLLYFFSANRVQYCELPILLLFLACDVSSYNSLFLLFSSSAVLGRAGLEAYGRAGLRRCRAALTLTGLGTLEDRKCSFSYAI